MRSKQRAYDAVSGAVTRGLGDSDDDLTARSVPTRVDDDRALVRFRIGWTDLPAPPSNGLAAASTVVVRQARAAEPPTGCYEIVAAMTVSLDALVATEMRSSALRGIEEFARSFRMVELRTVLRLLAPSGSGWPRMVCIKTVQDAVAKLNKDHTDVVDDDSDKLCRLLAAGSIVQHAMSAGVVHDAIDIAGALPENVGALVIPTVGGPVVERVGQDITLFEGLGSDDEITVRLVQRFFLIRPRAVEVLGRPIWRMASVGSGSPGCW